MKRGEYGRLVKDLDRMYMVFDTEHIDENEYILQMALRGKLPSLLPLSLSVKDGETSLRADVTGCTSIAARYKPVQLTGNDIRKILTAVRDTVLKLPGYLLDPGDLCLDPDYIFLGPGGDEVLLCYIPHLSEEDPDTIRILAEFFLKKLDHSDQTAANLSYGLFDKVSADQYMLGEVLRKLLHDCAAQIQEEDPKARYASSGYAGPDTPKQAYSPGPLPGRTAPGTPPGRTMSGPAPGRMAPGTPPGRTVPGTPPGRTVPGTPPGQENIRVLPPPDRQRRSAGRRKQTGSKTAGKGSGAGAGYRKKMSVRRLLPVLVIVPAAVLSIILFRMDLTQIGGVGLMSIALIWLTYSVIDKDRSEIHNVWIDEEDPGDDAFYQSLLKQVYAEDELSASQRAREEEVSYMSQRVREEEASPCLISLQPERCPDIVLSSTHMILGKSREKADIVLPDDAVSRVHARIELRTDGFYLTDLYSTNGTGVDGERLESGRATLLKDGSVISIGSLQYRFRMG